MVNDYFYELTFIHRGINFVQQRTDINRSRKFYRNNAAEESLK